MASLRAGLGAFLLILAFLGLVAYQSDTAKAQGGDFDYYVLSLSWSPSFCQTEAGRNTPSQCGSGRRYAFVVHGLWPQYHGGWPEYCSTRGRPQPTRRIIESMRDITPSDALIRHQWRKHGSCSGLTAKRYFALTRDFYERLSIPEPLRSADFFALLTPVQLKDLFLAANPDLPAGAIALSCRHRHLQDVRVCFSKDGRFRNCGNSVRRSCHSDKIYLPAAR